MQSGELAFDIEKPDLAKIEQTFVKLEPAVHVALVDIVGQVIEIVEPDTRRLGFGHEFERVIGVRVAITVGEIDQRTANADDGGQVQGAVAGRIGLGPQRQGAGMGRVRIGKAPAHRGRAGPVFGHKAHRMATGVIVQHIGDVALLPQLDIARPVPGGQNIAHAAKKVAQHLRIGMGEFDEFKAIGAGGILGRDHGPRGGMRKGTHGELL